MHTKLPHVCTIPHICSAKTPFDVILKHLATFSSLALIWIDSKTDNLKDHAKEVNAGTKVFEMTRDLLMKAGYKGRVLVGSPKTTLKYLETVAYSAGAYGSQYYFAVDELLIKSKPTQIIEYLTHFPSRNVVYVAGITACLPLQFYSQIQVRSLVRFILTSRGGRAHII